MRNLKKVLSLVLCLAMMLSIMVVGAGAAFSDQSKIVNDEAVDMCVALNIISGYPDGSYKPEGNVTRAQMCKMICIALNGGKEPATATKAVPTFSDIGGNWAEGYIEYCYAKGIVAGVGADRFNPDGNVTASQAAKMLLVALGYNADVEKFVGASWELYVNVQANQDGLYEDLETIDTGAALSRDNAAQMIWNTLQAYVINKNSSIDRTDGSIIDSYVKGTQDLLAAKYGAKIFVGTYMGNDKNITSLKDGYIQVKGNLTTDEENANPKTAKLPSDLDISNIGEEVKVIYKEASNGTAGQPDGEDTIYGVFNTGATEVINAIKGDIEDLKSEDAKIKIDGVKYDTTSTVNVITNYVGTDGTDYSAEGTTSANSALTTALKQANGDTIKFVKDSDGDIYAAYVVTSKLAVVTAVNSEKVSINNSVGTIKIADNDVYAGIAKDDVVVVTTLYAATATSDDAYTIVEKADVVSGTVNAYKGAEKVTLDGTVYEIMNGTIMLTAGIDDAITAFSNDSIGETFDLYLVNGYVAAAVQTSEDANNYSVVIAVKQGATAGSTFDGLQLQVLDAEGNKTIITVNDDSAKTESGQYEVGDIIVWTGSADDAKVTVKSDNQSAVSYVDKTKTVNGAVVTNDCVLFAKTGTSTYKAYSIRGLDSFSVNGGETVTNSDGKIVAVYAELGKTPAGASSNTVYGIVTDYTGTVEIDDSYYYHYIVAVDADTTYEVNTDADNAAFLSVGQLVYFDYATDNIYTAADVSVVDGVYAAGKASELAVYVDAYNEADGTLTYYTDLTSASVTTALADDAVIVYVDADADEIGSEMGINKYDSVNGYKNAAIVIEDNEIVVIFVETSNECDIF